MQLKVLGAGDAFSSGGKFNTCFHIKDDDISLLVDCGATSLLAIKRHAVDPNDISTIFITHFHGDHFGGLPFFILDAHLVQNRKKKLTIVGPIGLESRVNEVMEALFRGSSTLNYNFEIVYEEIPVHEEATIDVLKVRYLPVIHSPESVPHGLRLNMNGKIFAYSGDTEWTDSLIALSQDADLFITECYNYEGYLKFHMSYETLIQKSELFSCKRMMITHLGPEMITRKEKLEVEVCQDGDTIVF